MAHFAELDADDRVTRVIVIADADAPDETTGLAFLRAWSGRKRWVQTSFTGALRKNFAGVGFQYDRARNAFIAPRPDPSFTFDEASCQWIPPQPSKDWVWDAVVGAWTRPKAPGVL